MFHTALLVLASTGQLLFAEDFERGLQRWTVVGAPHIRAEGGVMVLETAGDIYALLPGSENWGNVRIEGDVRFPTDEHNYLGVIYNFRKRGERADFGVIYIKGNGSYLQANPHRDFNVSRLVYPEYHVDLTGLNAIRTGEWQRFRVEVVGREAHFYVGPGDQPQMTFPFFEYESGAIGLQPRCCGGPVHVDNLRVTRIERFSYNGPPRPQFAYTPDRYLRQWEVAGPYSTQPKRMEWRPFSTDERGAVISARVVDYLGPRTLAFFRTRVPSDRARQATLHLSTADDLAVWINGRFHAFTARSEAAWYDSALDPQRPSRKMSIPLRQGENEIVIRVRGGVSATGGFFARVE